MGAKEYELLVSTLNKLPILKENLPLKREEYELASRMVFSQKAKINDLQRDLKTRDLEVGKIDSEIEKIGLQVEKLGQEIADLDDNIKIEKKKVKPYSQRLGEASKHLAAKRDSFWNDGENKFLLFSVLGIIICFYEWISADEYPGMTLCGVAIIWVFLMSQLSRLGDTNSYGTKVAIRKRDEVKSEWEKASRAFNEFNMKRGKKKKKKASLVREEIKLKNEKERLIGLEKKLKKMNKKLDDLENSASACSKAVESLVREIHDGQNAIAPLIPYSDLLLDDGFL